MSTGVVKRRLTTVLSADVVGYSGLVAKDDEAAITRLRRYREIIETLIARHDGRVFSFAGDGLMAEFPSAVEAVRCALEMQEEVALRNAEAPPHQAMQFRIGINVGETITEGDDLLGDGVNIAARLQTIAEPGGVVVSASAYEQIKNKTSLPIEAMGPRTLKNIPEPVTVFRVGGAARTPAPQPVPASTAAHRWKTRSIAAAVTIVALAGAFAFWDVFIERESQIRTFAAQAAQPLPREPSIVVLPFVNASGDEGQEYFSDGVTEDIITDLTKIAGLFVVGRDSSFAYRGKFVQAKHVGRDLGVRYVLQGSVRREDNRVRVSTYLVDAATERTLWATRQDRTLGNVFAMQDEIAGNVAQALAVSFRPGDRENMRRQLAQAPDAYDIFLQGRALLNPPTRDNLTKARQLFVGVTRLEPDFAEGYAGLSMTYSRAVRLGHSDSPSADIDAAFTYARTAIRKDEKSGLAHLAMASAYLIRGEPESAATHAETAYGIHPGDANVNGVLGYTLTFAGRAKQAIAPIARALDRERDARQQAQFQFYKLVAAYTAEEYPTANQAYDGLIGAGHGCLHNCLAYAAATKLRLSDVRTLSNDQKNTLINEAFVLASRLKERNPQFIDRFGTWTGQFKNVADAQRIEESVRKALELKPPAGAPTAPPRDPASPRQQ